MIKFLKYKQIYFVVSGFFLAVSIGALFFWGLRPSIDFTGGSILELKFEEFSNPNPPAGGPISKKDLRDSSNKLVSIQSSGENYILRLKPIGEEEKNAIVAALEEGFGGVDVVRFETVGPTLGRELLTKTLIAVALAVGFIMFYAAWQFKDFMYGTCAVLAMLHDTIILLGFFAVLGRFWGVEVDTLFVTAVLTTLSLSVHDTVVVFNSVREEAKSYGSSVAAAEFTSIVNRALNATVVRALNDSFTIIFMLLCLVLLGGQTVHWFSVALLVGTILGTYSSTFIAAPLLTAWKRFTDLRRS